MNKRNRDNKTDMSTKRDDKTDMSTRKDDKADISTIKKDMKKAGKKSRLFLMQ